MGFAAKTDAIQGGAAVSQILQNTTLLLHVCTCIKAVTAMTSYEPTPPHYYSDEPTDKAAFTEHFDKTYTQIATFYNTFVKICTPWKRWLRTVLPFIRGPRVLEVSFGTGYLLTQIASDYQVHGVEYNEKLVHIAQQNLQAHGLDAQLVRGTVEDLPYPNQYFDTVIVTMAFTGYPDGYRAMSELKRVLHNDGRLLIVDINYPQHKGNCLGMWVTRLWKAAGDIIRDMGSLFDEFDLKYTDQEVGGFGSVHLYVSTKRNS